MRIVEPAVFPNLPLSVVVFHVSPTTRSSSHENGHLSVECVLPATASIFGGSCLSVQLWSRQPAYAHFRPLR